MPYNLSQIDKWPWQATAFDALAQSMDERIIRLARTARLFRTLVLARVHFAWHACRFALEDDIMRVKQKLDSKLYT